MGLLDILYSALNPDIILTYKDIINNHAEAFQRWKGRQLVSTFSELFWYKPTYQDKKYIALHKADILKVEIEISEEKAYYKRRKQVIEAAKQYPHAFCALLKTLSIRSIPDFNYSLPGYRKSNRVKRLESERRKMVEARNPLYIIPIRRFNPILDYSLLNSYEEFNKHQPKRSLETLSKEEYEKLYPHISSLSSDETKIMHQLKEEENRIKFEDEVLDHKKRERFYKQFLTSQHMSDSDIDYCVSHIPELDKYIQKSIHSEYLELRTKYPKGVRYCEENKVGYGENKEEVVLEKSSSLPEWEKIVNSYEQLKRKYPVGLPAFEHYTSFDDGKNSASLTIDEIIQCEEQIANFEKNAPISKFYSDPTLNWQVQN